jgi:LuxR family maltose regulon positive regulatory protein
MVLARFHGDMPALLAASEQLLGWLSEPGTSTLHAVTRQYEAPALNNRGVALVWSGRELEAEPYLRSAVDVAAATGADLTMVNSHAYLGLVELARGRLGAAAAAAGDGLELAEQRGGTELAQALVVYLVLAEVHLQRNDLDVAQVFVNRGLAAQRNDPEWTPYVALRALQARLLIAAGQANQADTVISALKTERGDWIAPARLRYRLAAVEAEIKLAQGSPADALDGLRPYLAQDGPAPEELSICAARAELAMGEGARAEERVVAMRGAAKSAVTEVWAWLITALAADSRRDDHRAVDAMDRALIAAEPEGIVRPFVGLQDPRVQAILSHRRSLGRTGQYAENILSEFEPSAARPVAAPLADQLTDRELVVLSIWRCSRPTMR